MASHRVRITKYRGSAFAAGEFPIGLGQAGLEVGASGAVEIRHEASTERISAGFAPLDAMLGGGLFRGSSTLITGQPGTAKTTLAATFAAAACLRGDRTLFVSFDEGAEPIARNLSSVGVLLAPHIKSGLLRMYSARTEAVSAEEHLIKLRALVREHRPRCMVIDPLSAIARAGTLSAARAVANRLIYMIKDERVRQLDAPGVESTQHGFDSGTGEADQRAVLPPISASRHVCVELRRICLEKATRWDRNDNCVSDAIMWRIATSRRN